VPTAELPPQVRHFRLVRFRPCANEALGPRIVQRLGANLTTGLLGESLHVSPNLSTACVRASTREPGPSAKVPSTTIAIAATVFIGSDCRERAATVEDCWQVDRASVATSRWSDSLPREAR